jgi:hypothetical protein
MAKGGRGKPTDSRSQPTRKEPVEYGTQPRGKPALVVDPLTPRPGLLVVLTLVFAVWMAFLVFLYFKTVYHHRSVAPKAGVAVLVGPPRVAIQSIS